MPNSIILQPSNKYTMQEKYVNRFSQVLFDSDLVSTRMTLAAAEFFWCVMLLWPGDTFDRPTYAVMSLVAGEHVWAFIFGVSSILQLAVVVSGDYARPWARVFAMWNAALWVFSTGSMFMSVYPPPAAIGGELALTITSLWIWARPIILDRGEAKCRQTITTKN